MKNYQIRYTTEIGTKAKSGRRRFMNQLGANIRTAIHEVFGEDTACNVRVDWDSIYLSCEEDLIELLARIPGIQNYSEVFHYDFKGYDAMLETAAEHFIPRVNGQSFAARCKRTTGLAFKSLDVERELGALIGKNAPVNLSNPDITCYITVKEDSFHVFDQKLLGMGGLPLGCGGRALTLFSGGIDSPVASWMTFRAGIDQDFVYFDLGGDGQKASTVHTMNVLRKNWCYGTRGNIYIVDFKPVVDAILKCPYSYQNVILKYCFYKASELMASYFHADALVTGESIGQVSTQTLPNLAALDRMTTKLILRPLSHIGKDEIIRYARRIGTFDLAYKGKEYCAIAGGKVVVASRYSKLKGIIDEFNWDIIQKVVDEREKLTLYVDPENDGPQEMPSSDAVELIDLRTEGEYQKWHADGAVHIPFQKAWDDYIHWPKDKTYFVYCHEGAVSIVLAEYMRKDGYEVEHLGGGVKQYHRRQMTESGSGSN